MSPKKKMSGIVVLFIVMATSYILQVTESYLQQSLK